MALVLALVNDDEIIITGPCVIKIEDHQVTKRVKLVFDAPRATRITRGKAIKQEPRDESRKTGEKTH